ncbi:hypothetical protein RND61_14665 [Streptomyces sp. TRM76323]|uniref:Uncharacterized protein n=1 Tax=Streptomyces tamarix TaxID=3078565 RepID=A0ABU3QKK1_9ACTN|nr:hypothetical protein [Streptomyces tamarix]MDT9683305.1 hypothetical protein [Streptomyces tamarix]
MDEEEINKQLDTLQEGQLKVLDSMSREELVKALLDMQRENTKMVIQYTEEIHTLLGLLGKK